MKKFSTVMLAGLLLFSTSLTSCIGSFELVKKVYKFNRSMDSKWVQELVFIAMNIIPVYSVAGFVDVVILNLIEFWSGSNPLALQEGETETQLLTHEGTTYLMTASRDRMKVESLQGVNAGEFLELAYNESTQEWYAITPCESINLSVLKAVAN
ncbi:MAG: DUF3332 family protein [Cytophagales bacterium]|nr:DUF3332 family protein [Cytophagales bacterium]